MVVKLDMPSLIDNENDFIDSVVAERTRNPNKTYFKDFSPKWKKRVAEYCEHSGNPELVENSNVIDITEKNKFINLYSTPQDLSVQKPMLDKLRERTLQLCPCCGEDGTPNTLDHYLPKDTYPEFSILSKNLFPMCDICQGRKGTKDVNSLKQRLFIHPYYDNFIDQQLLRLVITPPYESPHDFSIEVRTGINGEKRELVERHIKEIGFEERFVKYCNNEYFRLLKLVEKTRENEMDVSQTLSIFVYNACSKSVNSWGHLFYSSVIEDEDLLNFLSKGVLPEFR